MLVREKATHIGVSSAAPWTYKLINTHLLRWGCACGLAWVCGWWWLQTEEEEFAEKDQTFIHHYQMWHNCASFGVKKNVWQPVPQRQWITLIFSKIWQKYEGVLSVQVVPYANCLIDNWFLRQPFAHWWLFIHAQHADSNHIYFSISHQMQIRGGGQLLLCLTPI